MGLKTAGSIFQRLMNKTLNTLLDDGIFCYLDDIAVATDTMDKHLDCLERIFNRFRAAKLKLKPSKCDFLESQLGYLGHVLSADGMRTDPTNTEAIEKFPQPRSQPHVRSFYGLASYYRRFVKNFAQLSSGLVPLLKKDAPFFWSPEAQQSFDVLKRALATPPVLHYPDLTKKEYYIETDGSKLGVGAVLTQPIVVGERKCSGPIAYISRVLNDAEKNYPTTEIEALACVYAVHQFRSYIFDTQVHMVTDHNSLTYLINQKQPTGRLQRWILALDTYNIIWHYRKGAANQVADALSRLPVGEADEEGLDAWTDCYAITIKGTKLSSDPVATMTTRSMKRKLQELNPLDGTRYTLEGDENLEREAEEDADDYDVDWSVQPSTSQTKPPNETTLPSRPLPQIIITPSTEKPPTTADSKRPQPTTDQNVPTANQKAPTADGKAPTADGNAPTADEKAPTSTGTPTPFEGECREDIDFDFDYERMESEHPHIYDSTSTCWANRSQLKIR
ncbi:MAG: hypothetical protein GY822_01550, partial [Deltaproteobacteria bacterium]|nr:hypothetical protein [Deltaproteobacteria bacterium]